MMNITTSKTILLWSLSVLLLFTKPLPLLAQSGTQAVDARLKQKSFYQSLPKSYYVAVLPVVGCFSCEALLHNQIKATNKQHTVVVIYPDARKIEQQKIIKESKLNKATSHYIFEDKLYDQLYNPAKPKGYIKKVQKTR